MTGVPHGLVFAEGSAVGALPVAPYRGIEPFRYVDRPIFFGRQADTRKLLRLITMYRGTLLYGDSGAGKSSLVNAGLLPEALGEDFAPERVRVQPRCGEEFIVQLIPLADENDAAWLPSLFGSPSSVGNRIVLSTYEFKKALCYSLFSPDDLHDPASFVQKLRNAPDRVSDLVRTAFSREGQSLLANFNPADPPALFVEILVEELDRVLQTAQLVEPETLAVAAGGAPESAHLHPQGPDLVHLNRRILESAWPGEIRKVLPSGRPPDHATPLVVFDQFEEFYTLFEEAPRGREALRNAAEAQRAILSVLLTLLNYHLIPIKLLFVFREDYLAKLFRILSLCPNLPDQHLRLEPLRVGALPKIIRGPFKDSALSAHFGHELSSELAGRLAARIEQQSYGGFINLSEVQIACLRLWNAPDPDTLFEEKHGVQGLLEDYLSDALKQLSADLLDPAVALLTRMVTNSGTRNVVSKDDLIGGVSSEKGQPAEVVERALDALENDLKLIRHELRRDVDYFEIVSEFLVPWISEQKAQRIARIKLAEEDRRRREWEEMERRKREAIQRRKSLELKVVAIVSIIVAAGAAGAAWYIDQTRTAAAAQTRQVSNEREKRTVAENALGRALKEKSTAEQVAANAGTAKQTAEGAKKNADSERDAALKAKTDADRIAAQASVDKLAAERARDAAIRDRDQALRLRTAAESERDKALAAQNAANAERDAAVNERDAKEMKLVSAEADGHLKLGNGYLNNKDYDRAVREYSETVRLAPNSATAFRLRGNAYHAQKKNDEALSDYNKAIELRPDDALAYGSRGFFYDDQGQYDLAIADYNRGLQTKPEDAVKAQLYLNRGVSYSGKGDSERAIADYTEAIKLKPDYSPAYMNRAMREEALGQIAAAIADLNKALQFSKDTTLRSKASARLRRLTRTKKK